jgi:hypothetical protein
MVFLPFSRVWSSSVATKAEKNSIQINEQDVEVSTYCCIGDDDAKSLHPHSPSQVHESKRAREKAEKNTEKCQSNAGEWSSENVYRANA